jgi:hypothetical protein
MGEMSRDRVDTIAVNSATSMHQADQIGFEEAVALVKKHPGAILVRTKNGSCMVRLADGSILGVTPPTGRPDNTNEIREKSEKKLLQEIDKLNKVVLMNKNILDKAHHHLRDKDMEIKNLKSKLEEKDKESQIQNKIIIARGKQIEELKSEIKTLKIRSAKASDSEWNTSSQPCAGIYSEIVGK